MTFDGSTNRFRDFSGVVAALVTPFDESDELDAARLGGLVDFVVSAGVAGIMAGGTTGEFVAMTTEERARCNREAVAAAAGRVPVIAHVGHVRFDEAARLAESAAAAGADALAAITPYYHPVSEAAVASYLRRLAGVVPDAPFFAYVFPGAARNTVSFDTFRTLRDIPNLVGVKLSVAAMADIEPYLSLAPGFCVMSGNDLLMPQFVAGGGRAVVSGNATVYPELAVRWLDALTSGDGEAALRFGEAMAAAAELSRDGAPDRFKGLLARRGVDAGRSRVRTFDPGEVDPADEAALLARVDDALATDASRQL